MSDPNPSWTEGTFQDLVCLVREKRVPSTNDRTTRCINLEDIEELAGRLSGWSLASDNLSSKTKFKKGDILFGKLRPYLRKYAQATFDGLCTTEILVFRANDGVYPDYAYQVTASDAFVEHNVAASYGTKMPRTDWKTSASFPLTIPPYAEQRRIAELLSSMDEQIEQTEVLIDKTSQLLDGLIDDLLMKGARTASLGAFALIRPETTAPASDRLVPFLPMESVTENGQIVDIKLRKWSQVNAGFTRFASNDILIAKITPCFENGKGTIVPMGSSVWTGSTEFHVLRAKHGVCPKWIYWHTRAREFRQKGAGSMTGSAGQQRVPSSFVENFPIKQIEHEEQVRMANALDAVDCALIHEREMLVKLRATKESLMNVLLRGKVRL